VTAAVATTKPKSKYRLLVGRHAETVGDENIIYDAHSNNIIETTTDLCKKFNSPDPNFPKKFERVVENPEYIPATQQTTLDSMSFKEIQAWAAEEEIDLKGAKTKEDALKVIRATVK
jgi:hypothetical protein